MAVKKIETLNKHQNPATNENEFDIENYMNVNWDKIKEVVDNNADELTTAQEKVTALETDNTTNKQDISNLKSRTTTLETDNETNKTNISTLQEDVEEIEGNITELQTEQTAQNKKIEELDDNQIHVTTEKASNLNIQDCSGQNAKIKLFGISKQEGTPSPENSFQIENTTGDIDITVCNKNFFDENDTNNFKYGVGDDFTTKNDDGTFKTIANFSLGRNKGTKIVGLKANTDYIVSLDIKNITSTATSKAAEVEIIENAEKISIVMQKDFKNLGINTLEFNSGSYQDLSLHISGYTYSEVSKSVSVTFADVLIAEKSNDNSYVEHEQQVITFPLAENQKMLEGSETKDDGIHHKRKQITLTGNEQIVKYTKTFPNGYGYRVILNDVKANTEVLSSIYPYEKFSDFYWADDITNKITTHNEVGGYVLVGSSKATIEEFRQEIAGSVLEYETIEETIEAYTEEQQTAYNQLQNAKTYKTVTNVFTDNAEVEMEYVAHTKTYIDNEINSVKEELNTIKELLSTTTTSAMLLDNMQTDLESEVL